MSVTSRIHKLTDVQSTDIGDGTTIWQFVIILPKAKIGSNVNICSHCLIENDVIIGDRVTIKSGVQLWDGIEIGNDVFIGPNVSFTNDKFPRSKQRPAKFLKTRVEAGASIGAGAVILPGLTIGKGAMVGAGAIVSKSVPPYAIVTSPSANIVGYVAESHRMLSPKIPQSQTVVDLAIGGSTLHQFKTIKDTRGDLSFGEFLKEISFNPKRYFLVTNVPEGKIRGQHAHYRCHQFLICVKGACCILLDDGKSKKEVKLNALDMGVYIPPLVWCEQYKYSHDAVLLVFASEYYDTHDYIRDYRHFCELKANFSSNEK